MRSLDLIQPQRTSPFGFVLKYRLAIKFQFRNVMVMWQYLKGVIYESVDDKKYIVARMTVLTTTLKRTVDVHV